MSTPNRPLLTRYASVCYGQNDREIEGHTVPDPDGRFVRFDDHVATIAERDAEIARLREGYQVAVDALQEFGNGLSLGASHPHLSNYVAFHEKIWHDRRSALSRAAEDGITPTEP